MKFPCTVSRLPNGHCLVTHSGADAGEVRVSAETQPEALDKMRRELQYRLELCPCSGESYRHLEVEIVAPGSIRT